MKQKEIIKYMKTGYIIVVSEHMVCVGGGGGWTTNNRARLFKGTYGSGDGIFIPIKISSFESLRKKNLLKYIKEIRNSKIFVLKKKS